MRHRTGDGAAPVWRVIDGSRALLEYERSMRLRHAESPAAAIAADLGLPPATTSCRTIARFVIDACSPAREAADPEAALDETFRMIEAACTAAHPPGDPTGRTGA
ncbi:hypothetical protein SUDANB180_00736 [Streptomyces sp. enrichment culture]